MRPRLAPATALAIGLLASPTHAARAEEPARAVEVAAPPAAPPAAEAAPVPPPPVEGGDQTLSRTGDLRDSAGGAPQKQPFIKGELTHLGQTRLTTKNKRFGVRLGYEHLGDYDYARVNPEFDWRWDRLGIGLGVPLRFEVCQGAPLIGCAAGDPNRGRFRKDDYLTYADYGKLLRYVTYGQKEDHLYINVTQLYASTLGHGGLLRRYYANANIDAQRVSAELDAYNDYLGMEAMVNDVLRPNIVGALFFLKPLSLFTENETARSFSVGATWASDFRAPTAVKPGVDLVGTALPDDRFEHRTVAAIAVDAELKVVKTEHWDVKPFVEWAQLLGAGDGLTVGVLTRANAVTEGGTVHAFRIIAEVRNLAADYVPGYFDTFYEIQKLQYITGAFRPVDPAPPTKWEVVSGRGGERGWGYLAEATWSPVGALALSIGHEDAMAPMSRNTWAHLEIPFLDWFQLFGTVHRRNWDGQSLFDLDATNTLFFSGARLRLLPFLFFNGGAYQTFLFDQQLGKFRSTRGFYLDGELGWEF